MAQIFLSYDHEDRALADPLVRALEKAGHTVWFDRQIHGGAQYSRKIEQELDAADAVIVLWTERSLDSAWVRDEAAEARDRNKLVPLSVGGVSPPMGFRQFQTISLGSWNGRGKVPQLSALLHAIDNQASEGRPGDVAARPRAPAVARPPGKPLFVRAAIALLLLLGLASAAWWWLGSRGLPVIEVAAADRSSRSQAAASDLYVKLGALAQVGEGKWHLVDEASEARPDLIFRTADLSSGREAKANLVLVDGKKDVLLWSREFGLPNGTLADLRQQLALTAGRVLGCALETRDTGGLRTDLFKRFLDACALSAEISMDDPDRITGILRSIVTAKPKFVPAWGRLLFADTMALDLSTFSAAHQHAERTLRRDVAEARRVAPDLPQIRIAEARLLAATSFGERLDLLAKAAAQAPDNADIQAEMSGALASVGRMHEAVQAARRAAELDPLSPSYTTHYIMSLAYAGMIGEAKQELSRAEKLWAGTGALRDALWAFHLRFGEPSIAMRHATQNSGPELELYLNARQSRSPEPIARFLTYVRRQRATDDHDLTYHWAMYAFAEFGQLDEAFATIAQSPPQVVADSAYVLFRGPLAALRHDRRFMAVAKRIGLADYWRSSNRWPDFCSDPALPYDCKAEAAKHGR